METKQSQIKINLSNVLKRMVEKRAEKYGVTLAGYTKYLILKDIEESEELKPSVETTRVMELVKIGKAKFYRPKSTDDLDRLVDTVK